MTNELQVIPASLLRTTQHTPALQISKYFLKSQIVDIRKKYDSVKSLGDAAAEEWIKGLEDLGKERRHDAARWERWEETGGLVKMQREIGESSSIESSITQASTTTVQNHAHLPQATHSNLHRQFILHSAFTTWISMSPCSAVIGENMFTC
jgi:hypothetical protein